MPYVGFALHVFDLFGYFVFRFGQVSPDHCALALISVFLFFLVFVIHFVSFFFLRRTEQCREATALDQNNKQQARNARLRHEYLVCWFWPVTHLVCQYALRSISCQLVLEE